MMWILYQVFYQIRSWLLMAPHLYKTSMTHCKQWERLQSQKAGNSHLLLEAKKIWVCIINHKKLGISHEIYYSIPRTFLLVKGFGDTELVNVMQKNTLELVLRKSASGNAVLQVGGQNNLANTRFDVISKVQLYYRQHTKFTKWRNLLKIIWLV